MQDRDWLRVVGRVTGYTVKPLPKQDRSGHKYTVCLWVDAGGEKDIGFGYFSFGPLPELRMFGRAARVARNDVVSLTYYTKNQYNNLIWNECEIVAEVTKEGVA